MNSEFLADFMEPNSQENSHDEKTLHPEAHLYTNKAGTESPITSVQWFGADGQVGQIMKHDDIERKAETQQPIDQA